MQPLPLLWAYVTEPSTGETTSAPAVAPSATTRSRPYWLRPWWVPPLYPWMILTAVPPANGIATLLAAWVVWAGAVGRRPTRSASARITSLTCPERTTRRPLRELADGSETGRVRGCLAGRSFDPFQEARTAWGRRSRDACWLRTIGLAERTVRNPGRFEKWSTLESVTEVTLRSLAVSRRVDKSRLICDTVGLDNGDGAVLGTPICQRLGAHGVGSPGRSSGSSTSGG